MSKIINNLILDLDEELSEKLAWLVPEYSDYRILKKSIDARKKNIKFIYSVEVSEKGEVLEKKTFDLKKIKLKVFEKPIVIGAGPAGLFAALRMVERGLPCILLEKGSRAEERIKGINRFWRYGELNPSNNVCFGEGGAGLYSDGKLITRIKSPHIPYVLRKLVEFGAPKEIEYLSNPHVGSDKIRRLIPNLRKYLIEMGCEIYFDTPVTDLIVSDSGIKGVRTPLKNFMSSEVILATGHSAQDIFEVLNEREIFMEGKSFAMGLRIEHNQNFINQCQYGDYAKHPKLKSANYKLADHNHTDGVGVYSFCMCPGGYVLSSGTEVDGLVCNGMSNFNRSSPFANSAIVVSINHEKNFGSDIWGGMKLRRELETKSYQAIKNRGGTKQLPVQKVTDFLDNKVSAISQLSSPSGGIAVHLNQLIPSSMYEKLSNSLITFNKKMPGFITPEAHFYGMESRTSCPLRVTRDELSLESKSHKGLYPVGEGAGYAGGITSAACDGVRVAEKILEKYE